MEKKLEHKIPWKVLIFLSYKKGIHRCPNEYLKSCDYKRPESFFKL